MKCPNCGRDNEDNGKFCKYCGCPLNAEYPPPYYNINMNPPESEKKQKFKARLRAVLVSVLFVFLLFGCQSCVTSGYTFSLMSGMSVIPPNQSLRSTKKYSPRSRTKPR